VAAELTSRAELTSSQAAEVLCLASLEGTNDHLLGQLDQILAGNETGQAGVARLRDILQGFVSGGGAAERLQLDVSIARGLDYYTGPIYETFLDDLPDIGSVCSGGRYDDLASMFTKQQLPGVGASLGLDRLLAAQEELGLIEPVQTPAPVLVAFFAAPRLNDYLQLASWIRAAGIGVELYPEPKKLGQQLKYADRKGFQVVLIVGDDEWQAGVCQLKNLRTGEQQQLALADNGRAIVEAVERLTAGG
jgi:histidyl-tRNA synthetase